MYDFISIYINVFLYVKWELEKLTRLEEVGRVRHLLQLRERLGLDTNPNPTTKTEKDVCNLAARASTSPAHMVIPPSPQTPINDGPISKVFFIAKFLNESFILDKFVYKINRISIKTTDYIFYFKRTFCRIVNILLVNNSFF